MATKKETAEPPARQSIGQNLSIKGFSVPFIPNEGQWDSRAKFRASLLHGNFWVTQRELVYSLSSVVAENDQTVANDMSLEEKPKNLPAENRLVKNLVFQEIFLDKYFQPVEFKPAGLESARTRVSWFRGQMSDLWKESLSSFQTISLGEVYPGIEVQLKASSGNIEKIFYLKPGASVKDLRVKVSGVSKLAINKNGELVLVSEAGILHMRKPLGYQEVAGKKKSVEVAYSLLGPDSYGFEIKGKHDPKKVLIIDPALSTLSASTFLGGKGNDRGYVVAVGSEGKIYVAGYTLYASNDFPVTGGVLDETYNGLYDVFIARFSPDLKTLEAATYLGGRGTEYVFSMVVSGDGSLYLSGVTNSTDFPVTASAYQKSYGGGDYDTFVARVSPDLSILEASSYLGGRGLDYASGLALAENGYVYLTGTTNSTDFPLGPGLANPAPGGNYDCFITKLNAELDSVNSSILIGGSDYDTGAAVSVGSNGKVFVAGRTRSTDFPVTAGAFATQLKGNYDGFIMRLDAELSVLEGATYLGGSGYDYLAALMTGQGNDVFVSGYTASDDFPTSSTAFSSVRKGSYDLFISRLSDDLQNLISSTYYGGTGDDRCRTMLQDSYGYIYVSGWTRSSDLNTTLGAYDRSQNGGWDGFIVKFPLSLTTLFAGTYLGGSSDDFIFGLALDGSRNIYATGYTLSSSFPSTEGAYDTSIESIDAFVANFAAPESYQLAVNLSGDGAGEVKSYEGGINCPGDCSEVYDAGLNIVLEAKPAADSVFGGWKGDVVSTEPKIVVYMDSDKSITARFVPADDFYTLTVIKTGTGTGRVTSEDGGIDCGTDCSEVYPAGTVVKLTATADENAGFEYWEGDAAGDDSTVSIIMDSDKQVVAVFGPTPLPDLTGELRNVVVKRMFAQVRVLLGYLKIQNIGQATAYNGYKVNFYLSEDGSTPTKQVGSRLINFVLVKGTYREIMFVCYIPNTISVSGKYLMAVIDPNDVRPEKNENNNKIVFGPLE
ncbi:MAG: SBBP repeat-containing protein [Candidatus Aminicenantes bacterium]|nr:SBBP repeat-containing protein [Candidatus Aminicenantes bacterium]